MYRWWWGMACLVGGATNSGCSTPEAGRSQAPASGITIEAREGSSVTVNITGDANGRGQSAPESAATQTATTTVDATASVPVK